MVLSNNSKGKKAEKIVEDLFKEAGFEVYKYGYEHTLPKVAKRRPLIKGKAGEYIRHMPDFVVVNDKSEAFFVEVKHRSSKIFPERDIFPYPNGYVVLLTKDFILAQSTSKLFAQHEGFEYLTEMKPFKDIDKKLIFKYIEKLRRTLGDESLKGQLIEKWIKKTTGKTLRKTFASFEVVRPVKKTLITNKGNTYHLRTESQIPPNVRKELWDKVAKKKIDVRKLRKDKEIWTKQGDWHYILLMTNHGTFYYSRKSSKAKKTPQKKQKKVVVKKKKFVPKKKWKPKKKFIPKKKWKPKKKWE